MSKELSMMSLKELWALFPIILKPHHKDYAVWYKEAEETLLKQLKEDILRINHIGSTAVKDLVAKPIIDVLMEVKRDVDVDKVRKLLTTDGWILMHQEENKLNDIYNKGYTIDGFAEKVYHLHVRYFDDHDELYFRDYLREDKEAREEYTKLKEHLAVKYQHHRDHYTEAKSDFIQKTTLKARKKYHQAYKKESQN